MLKEHTGNATCLLNRAHKTRTEALKNLTLRRVAQGGVVSLQSALIQGTLAATM